MKNFAVEVILKGGTSLRTEEPFTSEEDGREELVDRLDDRETPWKDIGHLTLHFMDIVGFGLEELSAA